MEGDINANFTEPEGTPQGEVIRDNLVSEVLEDMVMYFLARLKLWLQDMCTWSMRRDGR